MKRALNLVVLAVAVYAVATKSGRERVKRARDAYSHDVASGSKPIEAVGTAIAAFARSPGVVVEEVPEGARPMDWVDTSIADFGGSDPEEP